MATQHTSAKSSTYSELRTTVTAMALLVAVLLFIFLIGQMVNHRLGPTILVWFLSSPGGATPTFALAAEASVAVSFGAVR